MSKIPYSEKKPQNGLIISKLMQNICLDHSLDNSDEFLDECEDLKLSLTKEKNQSSNLQIDLEDESLGNSSIINCSHIYLPNLEQKKKSDDLAKFAKAKSKDISGQAFLSSSKVCSESQFPTKEIMLNSVSHDPSNSGNKFKNSIPTQKSKQILSSNDVCYYGPYIQPNYFSPICFPSQAFYRHALSSNQIQYNSIQGETNSSFNSNPYSFGLSGGFNNYFPRHPLAIPSFSSISSYVNPSEISRSVFYKNESYMINRANTDSQLTQEETLDDVKSEVSTNKSLIFAYSDLKDFCQNCSNPMLTMCSLKGSKIVLKLLKESTSNIQLIDDLFHLFLPHFEHLMKNTHGSLVFQDLTRLLNENQRRLLWTLVRPKTLELGTNRCSSVCIHILLDLAVSLKEQNEIGSYFQPFINELSYDKIGNHILQKIILNFPDSSKKSLLSFIWGNLLNLVYDPQGVCLVKTYVIFLKEKSSRHKSEFLEQIMNEIPQILCEKHGHFFVLCMIEQWKYKDFKLVVDYMKRNLVHFALNKYSSKILLKILGSNNLVSFYFNI